MHNLKLVNETRNIGSSQGYEPLSILDQRLEGVSENVMTTAWKPDIDELAALNRGGSILLSILGTGHPPVLLTVKE